MNSVGPEATLTLPVDLFNPGQFFACCGLLELAHRLTQPGQRALGWFEGIHSTQSRFLISALNSDGSVTLEKIIGLLKKCEITAQNPESKEGPVFLGEPLNITIDWRSPFPQNSLVKTFAGKQNIFEITQVLQQALPESCDNELLDYCYPVDKAVTAFGIEKAEDTIDAGFSMDVQKDRLFRRPPIFLELLAQIGVQRFCPLEGLKRLDRIYYAWAIPLPAFLASIAVSYPFSTIPMQGFFFQMYKRDPQGRYKGFAPSRKLKQ